MASELHQDVETVKDAAFVRFKLGEALRYLKDALPYCDHGEQLRRTIQDVELVRSGEGMRGYSASIRLFGEVANGR